MPEPIFIPGNGPDVLTYLQPVPAKDAIRGEVLVASEFLAKNAELVMAHAVQDLARKIMWDHQADISKVVADHLFNREWCEPIIEDAIRKAVREWIREMMASSPFGEALAAWEAARAEADHE